MSVKINEKNLTFYPLVVWLPYIHNSKRGCRCRSVVVSEVELFAPVSANKYHLPFLLTHPRPLSFYQVICVTKMIFLPQRNSKSSIYSFLSPVFLHLAHTGIISKTPGLIVFNLNNTSGKTISPGVAKHTGERIFQRKIRRGIRIIPKRGFGGALCMSLRRVLCLFRRHRSSLIFQITHPLPLSFGQEIFITIMIF